MTASHHVRYISLRGRRLLWLAILACPSLSCSCCCDDGVASLERGLCLVSGEEVSDEVGGVTWQSEDGGGLGTEAGVEPQAEEGLSLVGCRGGYRQDGLRKSYAD